MWKSNIHVIYSTVQKPGESDLHAAVWWWSAKIIFSTDHPDWLCRTPLWGQCSAPGTSSGADGELLSGGMSTAMVGVSLSRITLDSILPAMERRAPIWLHTLDLEEGHNHYIPHVLGDPRPSPSTEWTGLWARLETRLHQACRPQLGYGRFNQILFC